MLPPSEAGCVLAGKKSSATVAYGSPHFIPTARASYRLPQNLKPAAARWLNDEAWLTKYLEWQWKLEEG